MPPPGPGQVQVRTRFSTISAGTEGWCLLNQFTWQPTTYPCVPGYQRTGEIIALGDGVGGWQTGDRCMATVGHWQGDVMPFWGAHGAVLNTAASELYRIPSGVDEVDASACVVAQVGYNAASRLALQPGQWVIVYGDGIIGQSAAQAAKARGARVIVAGHRQARLDRAVALGAAAAFDTSYDGFAERVREAIGGGFVTAVIDTVQTESAQEQYTPLLEYANGQISYSGFTPGKVWADMGLLQRKELTAHFVAGWTRPRMEATLDLMAAGKMRIRPLVTHLVPYTDAPAMWDMILRKDRSFMAINFDWTGAIS